MPTFRSNSGCMPPLPATRAKPMLIITRTYFSKSGTLGTLTATGLSVRTLERSVTDPLHPCVSAGTYRLIPYNSPTHGKTWCLHNPDMLVFAGAALGAEYAPPDGYDSARSDVWEYIEIHAANWPRQLMGCIAPGLSASKHPIAVWNSRKAMAKLHDAIPWEEAILHITGEAS